MDTMEEEPPSSAAQHRVPVVLLTGHLGAGKTTLLRRILTEDHGLRVAVVENEFADSMGIESLILKQDVGGPIAEGFFELSNGCLCCTQRDGLVDTLQRILRLKRSFDLILIETSGQADPGPVAAAFWTDLGESEAQLILDRVITVIDSAHFLSDLSRPREAGSVNETARQVCFADSILLNKMDLIPTARHPAAAAAAVSAVGHLDVLRATVRELNPTAEAIPCTRCDVDLRALLLDDIVTRAKAKGPASSAAGGGSDSGSIIDSNRMLSGLGRKLKEAGLLSPTPSPSPSPRAASSTTDTNGAGSGDHFHDSGVGSFVWRQSSQPTTHKHQHHEHRHHSDDHCCDGDGPASIATDAVPKPLDYERFRQWLGIVLWEKRVPCASEDFPGLLITAAEATSEPVPSSASFDVFRIKGAVWLANCPPSEYSQHEEGRAAAGSNILPLTRTITDASTGTTTTMTTACCHLVQGVHDLFDLQPVTISISISSSSSEDESVPEIAKQGALVFIGQGLGSGSSGAGGASTAAALQRSLVECCAAT